MEDIVVSGVTLNKNEAKITICDVPDRPGIAARIFGDISKADIGVDMIIQNVSRTGLTDVSFTVLKDDLRRTMKIAREVANRIDAGSVLKNEDIAKVSIVGVGMRSHSGIAARMFRALASKRINIGMISTSEIKISCIIKKKAAKEAMRVIHKEFGLDKKGR